MQRRIYQGFAERIRLLMEELLAREKMDVAQVEARAKDVDSFVEKLARRHGKYLDPLNDMLDLAGVRIIAYYLGDVARIGSLIEREFAIDKDNSWRAETNGDPDRFGYASDHYVVSCSALRAALPEWDAYSGLRVEIQVRTVLQHAWAAIDHKLAYKRASDVPTELRRQLSRVSALLEVGDEQFEAARSASDRLDATYDTRTRAGDLDLPIDRSSVEAYVEQSPRTQRWAEAGVRAGFNLESPPWHGDSGVVNHDAITGLTQASRLAGFVELAQLDRFLDHAEAWGDDALAALRPAGLGDTWWGTPAFILESLVYIGSELSREELANAGADFYVDGVLQARRAIAG